MSGRLYLVGTPIGHLGDISQRARDTLALVSHIYAEDTRHSRALLSHLGIEGKKVLSVHAHSTPRSLRTALSILEEGNDVALVTDAGMPSVSDPGSELVRAAREAGASISVVPGPSAVTSAVALSGLVSGPFTFLGFLPRKGRSREEALSAIAGAAFPTVLFESPHRMGKTLADLGAICGTERHVAVCRELTKRFEETRVGPLSDFLGDGEDTWRGEITLVVQRGDEAATSGAPPNLDEHLQRSLFEGASVRDATEHAMRELSRHGQRPKRRDIYARALELSRNHPQTEPGEAPEAEEGDENPA